MGGGVSAGMLRKWISANRDALWALYIPAYLALFSAAEHAVSGSYFVSYLPLDDKIPFLPFFVLPYVLWYPLLLGTGLYLQRNDKTAFRRYMHFIGVTFTAATLFCFLVPNGQNLRPETVGNGTLCGIIRLLYRIDTNTNVFPSVHVLGCLAVLFALHDAAKLKMLRLPLSLLSASAALATVFIKQHSALDLISALAFGAFVRLLQCRRQRIS